MVKRFLTREITYSHLLMNVSESEAKMEVLKTQSDELRTRLLELKIDSGSTTESSIDLESKFTDEDIVEMKE
jgi:hypothetical protein